MKEATGELNMTVVTVVAIAAVAAFFYAFIWPNIKLTIQSQSVCSNGPNTTAGTQGQVDYVSCGGTDQSGKYTCTFTTSGNDGNNKQSSVTCKTK